MSGFGSDLHKFGLDPASPPDQAQWANLCRLLRALLNNPSLNIGSENSEIVMPQYTAAVSRAVAATVTDCPFGYVFTVDEVTYLRGGIITGGPDNETIADIELDLGSADMTYLWQVVAFTAISEDGVIMPGVESIDSITEGSGTTVPDNDIPTIADPTGEFVIVLGYYVGGMFIPTACGHRTINHCPGIVTG